MQQVIAGTYQLEQEIGSGGGGIVYLAYHLRLNKKVVLKADKRTIVKTRPEVLRQEVDVLKNLSHTYIPQVYDFFVENDKVYTVMDYIEGESFDKLLKQGKSFSQVQVIAWACQLLEALVYLHSRPPYGILHGDIKPANVMLTPEGQIRLIDFNIALALGEEGAVKVGYSRGYASPEHYGQLYTPMAEDTALLENTEILTDTQELTTETLPQNRNVVAVSANNASTTKGRLLDVRSDIYSLGATLYHILTGVRPAADAKEVVPITNVAYSTAVCAIIQKAMAPAPEQRYQSAAEMLYAFTHLYEADCRSKRYQRAVKITAAVLTALFLVGGSMAFTGLKQLEQTKQAYVLAEYAEKALQVGDVAGAVAYALQALPEKGGIFAIPYTAQAQKALTDALGVYDLSDGFKTTGSITLPSEPLKLVLAPNGKTAAAFYAYKIAVFDTVTQKIFLELPTEASALCNMFFLDDTTLLYTGPEGLCAYDVVQKQPLWTGKKATAITISADGKRAAAVYKDDTQAIVYDTGTGQELTQVSFEGQRQRLPVNDSFADAEDNIFALNQDGTVLAVSFANGGLSVFDIEQPENNLEIYDASAYTRFAGGFFQQYFAFTAAKQDESAFAVIDTERKTQTGGFVSQLPFLLQADSTGIYVGTENLVVQLNPESGQQQEQAYTQGDIRIFRKNGDVMLTVTEDKGYQFFDGRANLINQAFHQELCDFIVLAGKTAIIGSRNSPTLRILELENHTDKQICSYDATYLHDEARINAKQTTVMLFRYDQFRLYRLDGTVLADVRIPNAEQVYDQQYHREGVESWLEVLYYDGTLCKYSAENGALISRTQGEKPDVSLTEEFFTDQYHIVAPLHEAPIVYERLTGKELCQLEQDAYLTYVTQVDEYIITEYITADGQRYGLLLDESCQTLAKLPNLCDIVGKELIFDYPSGNLRRSAIYSLEELLALANYSREVYE